MLGSFMVVKGSLQIMRSAKDLLMNKAMGTLLFTIKTNTIHHHYFKFQISDI